MLYFRHLALKLISPLNELVVLVDLVLKLLHPVFQQRRALSVREVHADQRRRR